MPADWQGYIPHVPVVNRTDGEVTDCQADLWAYGLLKAMTLSDWASEYGAPLLEAATADPAASSFYGGASGVKTLQAGGTQVNVAGVYPSRITLVPLSLADVETLLVPSA